MLVRFSTSFRGRLPSRIRDIVVSLRASVICAVRVLKNRSTVSEYGRPLICLMALLGM